MQDATLDEIDPKEWKFVTLGERLSTYVAWLAFIYSLLVLIAYGFGIEFIYRPLAGGAATHPTTAIVMAFLSVSIVFDGEKHIGIVFAPAFLAMGISLLRLVDILWSSTFLDYITPFQSTLAAEDITGLHNEFGANSAFLMVLVSIAVLLGRIQLYKTSQLVSSFAIAFSGISLVSYAYGISGFYGEMSLVTASCGVALALGSYRFTIHQGFLRAVLSPYQLGQQTRINLLLLLALPFLSGFLFLLPHETENVSLFVGMYVVIITWLVFLIMFVSTYLLEKSDFQRRVVERRLYTYATTDALSGLYNRQYFLETAEREIERFKRIGEVGALWAMIIDIDDFKKINDTAGHAMGDMVIKAVSETLSHSVRASDIVGRVGGEEFAVLICDTSLKGAGRVSESLRVKVENLKIPGWTEAYGPITVSVGCACCRQGDSLEQLLVRADKALYLAKNAGKNRVVQFKEGALASMA